MKKYLFKSTKADIVDLDSIKGIVSGYFSAFGNIDSDGDILVQGAYAKSIAENGPESNNPRIQHLWQHDSWKPLGRPFELKEDDKGLFFRTKLSMTSWGKDALQLYDDGVINEHSVGINILRTEQVSDGVQKVLEVKLWEGSSVTWGANEDTPTESVKSLEKKSPKELIERMDLLSKSMRKGNMQDETYELILIEYEQIKTIINALLTKEPEKPTPGKEPLSVEQVKELLTNFKENLKK